MQILPLIKSHGQYVTFKFYTFFFFFFLITSILIQFNTEEMFGYLKKKFNQECSNALQKISHYNFLIVLILGPCQRTLTKKKNQ